MLSYSETRISVVESDFLARSGIKLLIKREDLNHPVISGNKWWKLKYNLEEASRLGHDTLLTFGGAYSNHIYATAAIANEFGMRSIGIIRGEERATSTLSFVAAQGMRLEYVTREDYRKKSEPEFIDRLRNKFGTFYLLPEGGTNDLAVKGTVELAKKLPDDFDYVCVPVGTGGTMAGLMIGQPSKEVIGYSSLKGGEFLIKDIHTLIAAHTGVVYSNGRIETDYHFGGYGKLTHELFTFIQSFDKEFGIPLEPVYTGKMIFGILEDIKKGRFERGTKILAIHTGGLQGLNRF